MVKRANSVVRINLICESETRTILVRYCHFGVSPVNYSDSDSDSPLQVEEVQLSLGKLKKNKATDFMGLRNEHLKLRGQPLEIYRGCNIRVFFSSNF